MWIREAGIALLINSLEWVAKIRLLSEFYPFFAQP
jgi:hypothetical protein